MLRITGGKFRGRKIKSPPGFASRPTLERVREALFDILGNDLTGIYFLDLYAGVGLVGIEALSRGAVEAVFVEKEIELVKILRENAKLLGVEAQAKIFHGSAASLILRLIKKPVDIIFLDPPYGTDEAHAILTKLGYGELSQKPEIIVQHHYRDPLPAKIGNLAQSRQNRYGESLLSFYKIFKAEF